MNEDKKFIVGMVIIIIIVVSFTTGVYLYINATKDPYDIEISTNDPELISSFHLNGIPFPSSDFPFNITIRQKSFECWIGLKYKVFESGAYVVVVADRVYFNYQSMVDNGGIVKLLYSGLYIRIMLLSD